MAAVPVEVIPGEFRGAGQPQVAVSVGGDVHVTFGKGTGIYHALSVDGGRTFSAPLKIAELPRLALGMRRGPRIVASNDLLVVSAISHGDGNLCVWTSKDAGKTWAGGAAINDTPNSAREGLHAMAGNDQGLLVATWLDRRDTGAQVWSATSRDGGLTWGANTRVYQSPDGHVCECCSPSVAVSSRGEIVVMWRNWLSGSRDLYLATSVDGGKTFGRRASSAAALGNSTPARWTAAE